MTLALGTSSASNIAAAAGFLVILLALRRLSVFAAAFFAAIVGLSLALALGGGDEIVRAILFPGKSKYEMDTASGRTLLWDYYWRKFWENPIIGSGFQVVSGGRDRSFQVQSHNMLFSVLTGTGLLGFSLFAVFLLRLSWSAIVKCWKKGRGTVGFMGALAAAFLNSLGMPLMADRWVSSSVVLVSLIALFLLHAGPEQQASGPGGDATPGPAPTLTSQF